MCTKLRYTPVRSTMNPAYLSRPSHFNHQEPLRHVAILHERAPQS